MQGPPGGIKVNSHLQTSHPDVYAIGDVATFPLKLTGALARQEHVTCCRCAPAERPLTPCLRVLPPFAMRCHAGTRRGCSPASPAQLPAPPEALAVPVVRGRACGVCAGGSGGGGGGGGGDGVCVCVCI